MFTVKFSGPATGDEIFEIRGSQGGFSYLPSELRPAAGATSISFPAIVSTTNGVVAAVTVSDDEVTVGQVVFVDAELAIANH